MAMTFADSDFITLDQGAMIVPGYDRDALKRLARRGKLTVYKPGKAYLTTPADVKEAVLKCRVNPKAQDCGSAPSGETPPANSLNSLLGLSLMEQAKSALDSALAPPNAKKKTR